MGMWARIPLREVYWIFMVKESNGFYRMSANWCKKEAETWGIYGQDNFDRATNNLIASIKQENKARAKTYY